MAHRRCADGSPTPSVASRCALSNQNAPEDALGGLHLVRGLAGGQAPDRLPHPQRFRTAAGQPSRGQSPRGEARHRAGCRLTLARACSRTVVPAARPSASQTANVDGAELSVALEVRDDLLNDRSSAAARTRTRRSAAMLIGERFAPARGPSRRQRFCIAQLPALKRVLGQLRQRKRPDCVVVDPAGRSDAVGVTRSAAVPLPPLDQRVRPKVLLTCTSDHLAERGGSWVQGRIVHRDQHH